MATYKKKKSTERLLIGIRLQRNTEDSSLNWILFTQYIKPLQLLSHRRRCHKEPYRICPHCVCTSEEKFLCLFREIERKRGNNDLFPSCIMDRHALSLLCVRTCRRLIWTDVSEQIDGRHFVWLPIANTRKQIQSLESLTNQEFEIMNFEFRSICY